MSTLKETVSDLFANEPEGRVIRVLELAEVLAKLQSRIGLKHRIQTGLDEILVGTLVKVTKVGCHFIDDTGTGFVAEGYHSGFPMYPTLTEVEDNVSLYHPMQGIAYPALKEKYGAIPVEALDQNDQYQNLFRVMKLHMLEFVGPMANPQPQTTALTDEAIIDILVERLPANTAE
jgi:hypothetical protein